MFFPPFAFQAQEFVSLTFHRKIIFILLLSPLVNSSSNYSKIKKYKDKKKTRAVSVTNKALKRDCDSNLVLS